MRLPSWIIVAAVAALVALAAADALRPTAREEREAAVPPTTTATGAGLTGTIVVKPGCAALPAFRLPNLAPVQPPRQTDCDGFVRSRDGTLFARCTDDRTRIGTSDGRIVFRVPGCGPAWREDGALGVIHDGGLLVARRLGRTIQLLSRAQLGAELENVVDVGARSYRLQEIAWLDSGRFAAIAHGARPWQQLVLVASANGDLEIVLPEYGAGIKALHASPLGDYIAYERTRLGRELVMMPVRGGQVRLPRIGNVLNVAWSPDETHVAISTRNTTFIAGIGTRKVLLEIPQGGDSLAWLP
jgi:hypothetical protein